MTLQIPTKPTVVQLLRNVPLFSQTRSADLEHLADQVRRVEARRKQVLFRQGDRCDGIHVIVYGKIKMSLLSWHGEDRPIQIIGEGGRFGDITMLNGEGYFLNVQALEDSLFLYLPRAAIIELIERDSGFAMDMLRSLSSRVRGIVDDIESYSLQPPTQRLVRYLLRLLPPGPTQSAQVELPVGKNIVAAHLNLTPETLSRCLRELVDSGLMTVAGRRLVIHNAERLGACLAGPAHPPRRPARPRVRPAVRARP